MLVLHHLERSRSFQIVWLLEELGLSYELRRYERDPKTQFAPAELKSIHPLGKVPALQDGDKVVVESAVIIDYLIENYGKDSGLKPDSSLDSYWEYQQWMHYAESSLMPVLFLQFLFQKLSQKTPLALRWMPRAVGWVVEKSYLENEIRKHMNFMSQPVSQTGFLFGDQFSAVDIHFYFALSAAEELGILSTHPHLKKHLQKLSQREACQKTLAKVGPPF